MALPRPLSLPFDRRRPKPINEDAEALREATERLRDAERVAKLARAHVARLLDQMKRGEW